MALSYPQINGVRYDFSSIEVTLFGQRWQGFKSIDYANDLKPGKMYGTSAQKMGRTRGQYDPAASAEIYKADFADLLALLTSKGKGYMEQEFDVVVQYAEGAIITTDTLAALRIVKDQDSHQEGTDPLTVKLDLDPMWIKKAGFSPITTLKP